MQDNIKKKTLTLITLVFAGEAIFFLPFVLPRIFRPTLLEVFQINNFELGLFFSFFGIAATVSYFFGGLLADRFAPRSLMTVALIITGLGGLIFAAIPTGTVVRWVYTFWGVSTILLFWAALQKATRELGGGFEQGRAFSFVEGGRGLAGALIGTVGVGLLAILIPDGSSIGLAEKTNAFQKVIWLFTGMTLLAGAFTWFLLPNTNSQNVLPKITADGIKNLVKLPAIWLQTIIILCAYVGYKVTDDFSLYAKEVLEFEDVGSSGIGTLALWMRPVVAIALGIFADRFRLSRLIVFGFLLMAVGSLLMSSGWLGASALVPFFITLIALSIGVYGVRGLYFAIMQEGNIPIKYTGSAVGIISVLGYTPDFFMGPLMGWLLDANPGALGHQLVFLLLSVFSIAGIVASLLFTKHSITKPTT